MPHITFVTEELPRISGLKNAGTEIKFDDEWDARPPGFRRPAAPSFVSRAGDSAGSLSRPGD